MIIYNNQLAKNYNTYHNYPRGGLQIFKLHTLIGDDPETRILDVGCGSGRLLRQLYPYYMNSYGVEYSKQMYNECLSTLPVEWSGHIFNEDFNNIEYIHSLCGDIDVLYFSYSLHQITPSTVKQIELLKKSFELFNCKNIILITASKQQFDISFLNKNSSKIREIDNDRFLFIEELQKHFNIDYYEEEVNFIKYPKEEYVDMLNKRYISTLQYLDDSEIQTLIKCLDSTPIVTIPDYYTYININSIK